MVPAVENELRRVEADIVGELQRTHRVRRAELHRRVDVLGRRVAALDQAHRFGHERHQQPIDDKAGRVAARHHLTTADN